MLSDREQRELMLIEQGLRDDRRLAATFGDRGQRRRWRRWPMRTVLGIGLLLVVTGLLLGAADLFLLGTVLVGIACLRRRWRGKRRVRPPRDAGPTSTWPRLIPPWPGQSPPEWLRPM